MMVSIGGFVMLNLNLCGNFCAGIRILWLLGKDSYICCCQDIYLHYIEDG
jgi:hypothetical protein